MINFGPSTAWPALPRVTQLASLRMAPEEPWLTRAVTHLRSAQETPDNE
jgi:hypothetical protein